MTNLTGEMLALENK